MMSIVTSRVCVVCVAAVAALMPARAAAQDLEPKAYSASPVGTVFLVVGAARSSGSVLTDPTLPLKDVEAAINGVPVAAGYTFGLFERTALVTAAGTWLWGDASGLVFEQSRSVTRSGFGDARLKFSINLVGNRAMGARAFAKRPQTTIVGASLMAVAPTGQYDGTKLINLGTHRWAFKPEVGISVPRGPWDVDAYLGVWLFTANPDFFPGGLARTQDPVVAVQGHGSYTFKPRLWISADATWYAGGATQVEGGTPTTAMNNSRLGATMSLPLGRSQSLKVAYSSGLLVRSGTNFRVLSIGWQRVWLTKP